MSYTDVDLEAISLCPLSQYDDKLSGVSSQRNARNARNEMTNCQN